MATTAESDFPSGGTGRRVVPGRPGEPGEGPERVLPPGGAFADPAPLGLAGFAMTTFFLSVVNAGLIPASVEAGVFGLAIFYGGGAQFAAGIWEFAKGNTFGAVAFCSYGAFWLSFWFLATKADLSAAGSAAGEGVGLYLVAWAIFTGYMMLASFRVSGAIAGVFVALFITYILLAIGAFSGVTIWNHAGGWTGIATALIAWYASFAAVFNFTAKRPVVPVWPRE
ncbi:MAG TPA: acetate uptake transporter [Segeticoccus sp.]|uniref:acetate uptake transporter n=1 Tax=Segeticoccus sp. TaxID=2706531 RepID=UPI002D80067B|nr:acetate uptake transporter [Segeticoccus sp.]HET8599017.1 acetate uptake transporter [Segeticoccus sp.]